MARRHRLNYELKLADGKVIEQVSKFELLGFIALQQGLKMEQAGGESNGISIQALRTLSRL